MISIFFIIFLSIDLAAGISVCKKFQRSLKVDSNKCDKFYQLLIKHLLTDQV